MVTLAPPLYTSGPTPLPNEEYDVLNENERFQGLYPDMDDMYILEKHVLRYIAANNAFLQDLFRDNWTTIVGGLSVAKKEIGGVFRGLHAGDGELGVQLIRPQYVLRTTAATEATTETWDPFALTANGDYWIGFGTDNTTAINIDKRLTVLPMAVWWTQGATPLTEEILWQVGNTTYPVNVVRHGWLGDNPSRIRAARIRPMIWKPKATVLAQTYQIFAGNQEMVLVGLVFGRGDLLRTQNPTTIQT